MRETFIRTIEELCRKDKNIYLLTGDLGFRVFDNFRKKYPKNFLNVGIAEPNMIGIASGLALSGKKVYCYSIIPFLTMRAYEQIRVDIGYNSLDVKLCGIGGGFTYGLEGFTHYGIEDLSLMRSVINMNVIVPASAEETRQLVELSYRSSRPFYIRLDKAQDLISHDNNFKVKIGEGRIVNRGKDVAIFAIGNMVYQAKQAIQLLKKRNITITLVDMHTLKPLDVKLIQHCASLHEAIFTVEEHSIAGGLGSAVAETLSECSYKGIFKRIGIPLELKSIIGDANYLREIYGLTADKIAEKILNTLGKE
jgi:transketolase